jgi:hypothetical protein
MWQEVVVVYFNILPLSLAWSDEKTIDRSVRIFVVLANT